jgi:hypothetical protein
MRSGPTIYADFQNSDQEGFVRLNTAGALADLARLSVTLANGLSVVISDGELLSKAKVRDPGVEGIWQAQIDWEAITRLG